MDSSTCTNKLAKFEDLEFKWGKRRGIGAKRKEVQFYESFTYDGVEYALHDCVYMHKEGEPEPYIGKIIKIWENGDKSKKIKLHWFFRPLEILYHLKDEKFMDNEIFLASGEGIGLSNVNPLEAIAGKCNVVCISEDSRNHQPSEEELKAADYVFYRVFDVGRCTLDKIGDRVGGLEVKFVFNRNESEKASDVLKLPSDQKEDKCATVLLNRQNSSGLKIEKGDGNSSGLVVKKNEQEVMHGDGNVLLSKLSSITKTKSIAVEPIEDNKVTTKILVEENVSTDKTAYCKVEDKKDEDNNTKPYVKVVGVDVNTTHIKDSGALDSRVSKRVKLDSAKPLEYKGSNSNKRSSLNDTKPQVEGVTASALKEKTVDVKDPGGLGNDVKSGKDSSLVVDRPSKKAKIDFSARISEDKNKSNAQKLNDRSGENEDKVLPKAINSSEEKMSKASKSSTGLENVSNSKISSPDDTKSLVKGAPPAAVKTKTKTGHDKHSCEMRKDDKSGKNSIVIEDRASKKAKVGIFDKISEDGKYNDQKPSIKHGENAAKVSFKATNSFKERAIVPKLALGLDEGHPKSKSSMKPNMLSNSNMPSLGDASTNEIKEFKGKSFEVTPRHVAESVTWFKELSWEERMQTANDQGKLVLLQNLDPGFTSAEVEDIIWHAFKEKCSAKMIQRTAFSSPNSGRALAIFKTREAAERVIKKLHNGYLMVSNQRLLVADIIALPKSQRNTSSFVGHLFIDKVRRQMQREMKEAVSTSHCSQPNTIEYEMAMEWRLLQSRSEFCWKRLYKQQREELRRVTANLKSK